MVNTHIIGQTAENIAVEYLAENKVQIIDRNYRTRFGEIDIIAKDKKELIFIEVKAKSTSRFGKPYEMVTERNSFHFKSYHNIGLLYHNRGETSLAADYYRKALSINPGYARSRVNLEAIKRQEGR